jgi:Tfp pilus assembly protein PilP
MKTIILLSALLLVAGCGRQSAFDDLKACIDSTPQAQVEPARLAGILSKVCHGDDDVAFLKQKIHSDNAQDAVAAYVVMTEIVAQARHHPTPELQQLAEKIRPAELAVEFSKVDASKVTGCWVEWLSKTEQIMKDLSMERSR